MDILRKRQRPRHFVGRVVISGDGDHGDAGLAEADHLRHEVEARPMVLPVSVVEVAGNQDEGHRLVDGQLHEVFQGPAAGLADLVDRGAFVALQPSQRAVQVDVGGVKEFEHGFRGKLRPRGSIRERQRAVYRIAFPNSTAEVACSPEVARSPGFRRLQGGNFRCVERNLFRWLRKTRQRNKFRLRRRGGCLHFHGISG